MYVIFGGPTHDAGPVWFLFPRLSILPFLVFLEVPKTILISSQVKQPAR